MFPLPDPQLFDEQSWDKWDSKHLTLFLETLKAILHEVYVIADEKKSRSLKVLDLLETAKGKQKTEVPTPKGSGGGEQN